MSSKNNEENGYGHDLEMATILHKLHVSYPKRSRCLAKSACLRFADLIVTMGTGLVNHCVQSGNAYQKALDIAQEIVKQVNMPRPHLHGNRMF